MQFFRNKNNETIIFINDNNNQKYWLINKNLYVDINFFR
jgi:hypothetical protein